MPKLFFCKTLAVMLMVIGGELLLETRTLAEDLSMSSPATTTTVPAVVEQVESPAAGGDDNKQQQDKQDEGNKEELPLNNPSPLSLATVNQNTHAALENTALADSSESKEYESMTRRSELTTGGDKQEDKQDKDKEEPTVPNSDPLPLPNLEEYTHADLDNTLVSETSEEDTTIEQVTNVTELSDVQPTDWAFEALRSLVERYGCLEGYPDRTYRGNRAMSRYEFAAGLNRCLERISELLTTNSNYVTKEDLARLQRLQEEYATEINNLKGRVDTLEARTTTLEEQQFSPTTKLTGQAITILSDAFGENADSVNNISFGYRSRLSFDASFTGKDRLRVRLQGTNLRRLDPVTNFPQGRLSGSTDETLLLASPVNQNGDILLNVLQYRFPIGKNLLVSLDAFSSDRIISAPITPYSDPFRGAISYYGQLNPILYPIGKQSGIGVNWQATPWLDLDFSIGSEFGSANRPNRGLFEGGYGASVRSAIDLGKLKMAFNYIHSYSPRFGVDTASGSNAAKVVGAGPVVGNTYLLAAFYRLTPMFEVGTSVGLINARTLGEGTRGDAQVWDYRLNLAFYDVGKKGNLAGIILGIQPQLTGTSNPTLAQAIGLPPGQRRDRDTGFHIEAFYSHRLNNNISITPGVFWLTAPNHDARNPDMVVGVVRTTFRF